MTIRHFSSMAEYGELPMEEKVNPEIFDIVDRNDRIAIDAFTVCKSEKTAIKRLSKVLEAETGISLESWTNDDETIQSVSDCMFWIDIENQDEDLWYVSVIIGKYHFQAA